MTAAAEHAASAKKTRRPRSAGPRVETGTGDARRVARVVLEVLGGMRTPTDAAKELGVSTQRYYGIEAQALDGLVRGCERKGPGRVKTVDSQISALHAKVAQLERECARRLALIRASQRTLGLGKPAEPAPRTPGKRPRKRPTVRALKAAVELDKSAPARDQGPS